MGRRRTALGAYLVFEVVGLWTDLTCLFRSSLRRRSLGLTRNLAGTMGGYLPGTLSDMWEPSRDFASLKLPTSGTRCIVALSRYVIIYLTLHFEKSLTGCPASIF